MRDVDRDNDVMNMGHNDDDDVDDDDDDDNVDASAATSSVNGDDGNGNGGGKKSRNRRATSRQGLGPISPTPFYPHNDRVPWSVAVERETVDDSSMKMIRIDRLFHVSVLDVQTPLLPPPPPPPLGQGLGQEVDQEHWLADGQGLGSMVTCIDPQSTWTLSYQLTTKVTTIPTH